jgi:hypothetical protein
MTKHRTVSSLSFVAMRDGKTLPKATKKQLPACFWNVAGTGHYGEDCEIGETLALEYLALEEADSNGMGHLPKIVGDMPRELTGVEVGFLCTVSRAAGAGAGTKNITERDDLIIAMALAYAIECVNRLPEEWREVRWFTPAGDAVDQRDMERLLISLRGGAEAANALRWEARGHIGMPPRKAVQS